METRGPWKVKDSSTKFKNIYFEVIEDNVIQPDGNPGSYAVVDIKPGVSVLPIDNDGFTYLVRQFRYAFGEESLEVAAGGINPGETPLEAARREAREELGIEAVDWIDLGKIEEDTSLVRSPGYLFLARDLTIRKPERESTENIKTVRIPFEEAVRRVMENEIVHSPSAVLILKALVTVGYE